MSLVGISVGAESGVNKTGDACGLSMIMGFPSSICSLGGSGAMVLDINVSESVRVSEKDLKSEETDIFLWERRFYEGSLSRKGRVAKRAVQEEKGMMREAGRGVDASKYCVHLRQREPNFQIFRFLLSHVTKCGEKRF